MHGIRRVGVPWALPGFRFTIAFERHAIDVLLETDVLGGTRLLGISWDEAWNIMERAVARGLRAKKRRVIARLGVDEKAVAKGHRYVTLVCDLDRATVLLTWKVLFLSKIVKLGKTVGRAIASYCVIDPVFQFGCGRQAALWNTSPTTASRSVWTPTIGPFPRGNWRL